MEEKQAGKTRKKQMIPIMLTAFITPFMGSALNLAVPSMSAYFSAGAVSIGWVVTAYLLASTALLIPFGKFADLHGKKAMFITGIMIFALFSAVCVFAGNIGTVILCRLGQGVGASMIFATNSALIASNFPQSMRGQLMGLSVMCTYLGLSVGPVLGGLLNQHLGWRSVFVFAFVYCIPSLLTSVFMLEGDKAVNADSAIQGEGAVSRKPEIIKSAQKEHHPDLAGCLLYPLASGTFLFGLTNVTTMFLARIILALSFVLIFLFIIAETRAEEPVLDLKMFTCSRTFTLSNIAALLNYGASSSISYLLSVYLQNVRGLSSARAGMVLIATPILQALLSPLAGRLSDHHSPYKLASAGMTLTCGGIILLIFLKADTPIIYLLAALAIIGVGFALFSSPNSNAIMSSADKRRYGVASSIMSASRTIGQTSSMAVVTMTIGAVIGNVTLASAAEADIVSALQMAFIINAVLCGLGIFCSARR